VQSCGEVPVITLMRPIATQGHLSDEICTRWSFSPKSGYGFRVIARKDGHRAKLYSRPRNDLTPRFPLIVKALARLRSRSCIIDGEAVARSARRQCCGLDVHKETVVACLPLVSGVRSRCSVH
jgi:ATP-dependent DNA ligase